MRLGTSPCFEEPNTKRYIDLQAQDFLTLSQISSSDPTKRHLKQGKEGITQAVTSELKHSGTAPGSRIPWLRRNEKQNVTYTYDLRNSSI
jgi:hypothetical protein